MNDKVRAKKHLGQHFLRDEEIALNIVKAIDGYEGYDLVLEVGPGMGVLTKYLIQNKNYNTYVIDIDSESIGYLEKNFPELNKKIIEGDFLQLNLESLFNKKPFALIGNFPYNISSQILFKALEYKNTVPIVVGMFQKEVAMRIASPPGNKDYGILSVLLQAYYDIEYLFTVSETVFSPPPKVKSGVIRLVRNKVQNLACDEEKFIRVVKTGFNQRRKTLRNALKSLTPPEFTSVYLAKRAEQLSVNDFVKLTLEIEEQNK
ncbi:MAG: 16S rRNA (adenine(1518)-N(6)/adenine(1519)-N(6))-dimethyltransferase RsmA [Bacteroidota bacterium]